MGELEHDIVFHSSDIVGMIYGINQDEYCHMDLEADINKATLPASNANVDVNENREVDNMVASVVNIQFEVENGETDLRDDDKEDDIYDFSFKDKDWRGDDVLILGMIANMFGQLARENVIQVVMVSQIIDMGMKVV
ncbi:unnamed protein product [Ilex paraguariensis]|uniref:Uncharacterized protein n=1 Tax=Ilex paraguariensis TaxID=185542 RepID=A0ABC8T550_9AQUA